MNSGDAWRTEVGRLVQEMEPWLLATRRQLHRVPEAGWTEFGTAAFVARHLLELGWQVRLGPAVMRGDKRMGLPEDLVMDQAWNRALASGAPPELLEPMRGGYTAVVAEQARGEGPVVAFRFDLDALPIAEAQDSEHRPAAGGWASERPGLMHACGHDGHVAIGLGLARLLTDLNSWSGTVRLIFQPAEEGCRGALPLADAGVVDDVDYLLGCHLGLEVPAGEVVAGSTGFLASSKLEVVFEGRAAHAGHRPEEGRNALLAAATAALGLHSLPQHSGGVTRVNVGALHSGDSYNVVAPHAVLRVETRSDQPHVNTALVERAHEVVAGAAAMYGCTVHVRPTGSATAVDSDGTLAGMIAAESSGIPGIGAVHLHRPFGASEDFTILMERVNARGGRAAYTVFGCLLAAGHHQPTFDFDETVLPVAVQVLCQTGLRLLSARP